MSPFIKIGALVLAMAVFISAPHAEAAKKKTGKSAKAAKSSARKPAAAGKGFKVKVSGDFTRVVDDEQGVVCYFAKKGGGSCVKLPK